MLRLFLKDITSFNWDWKSKQQIVVQIKGFRWIVIQLLWIGGSVPLKPNWDRENHDTQSVEGLENKCFLECD